MFYIKLSLYNFIKLYYYFCKVFICNMDIIILRGDFMINENNNLSTNLPTNLKIQLDILATENKTTTDNLILQILNTYVQSEFTDSEDIIE